MKKISVLMLSFILLFSLTACSGGTSGNGDSDPAGEASEAAATDSTDNTESTSETPTLDAIRESGTLVLLTNATFPPFEYVVGVDSYAGVDIDIGQVLADKLGVELQVIDMNFDLLTEALNGGKGDFIAAGMSVKEERKEAVDFTNEYLVNGLLVMLPADSTATSLDDLAGMKVSVQQGTTGDDFASANIDTDDSNILRFKSAVEAGNAVVTGKADAAILDKLPAESLVNSSDGAAKLMADVYEEELTAIAVRKGEEDWLEFINETLAELAESGQLQEFIDHHMVAAME